MITAIAIDDEPLALDIISTFCKKIDFIQLNKTFTETGEAFAYLEENPVDLLFLDINMPFLSGIDFYKKVSKNTMVIFTTAYSKYAVEGFNLNAADYLLKPFDFSRFQQAVEKAREYNNYVNAKEKTEQQFLFVRLDYSLVKIVIADILYVEGLDNYIKIHFVNEKPLLIRMSMKAIMEKLPESEFIRVHRSFIIPIAKATSIRNKIIYIKDKEIPVGTNYLETVMALFKDKS
jgi:DNA-binding LytR/AlgR family response regulator